MIGETRVKKLLNDIGEVIEAVEYAFSEKGYNRVQMPSKIYLYYKKHDGDLRVMPSYLEDFDISSVKIVNVHPGNRKLSLPTVMALILMMDPKTGAPMLIMDGTWITAMRTGAASGVATKYLARKNSKTLGIIGTGAQAITQLMAMNQILKLKEVKVFDREEKNSKNFINRSSSEYKELEFTQTETLKETIEDSDVICTLTPSRKPIIDDSWVNPGTHINAIGADAKGKEELDPNLLKRAKIVVDDYEQATHSGEVNVPISQGIIRIEDIYAELGEITIGDREGRTSEKEITIFDSTGLAIQDTITAYIVFKKIQAQKLGTMIDLKF